MKHTNIVARLQKLEIKTNKKHRFCEKITRQIVVRNFALSNSELNQIFLSKSLLKYD